jgi:hypothetical protein
VQLARHFQEVGEHVRMDQLCDGPQMPSGVVVAERPQYARERDDLGFIGAVAFADLARVIPIDAPRSAETFDRRRHASSHGARLHLSRAEVLAAAHVAALDTRLDLG